MSWDPVPYIIGNGAEHSEAVFRMLAFAAMNGNEGVLGPNDLKVTALGTPGAAVAVGIGSCGMIGRGASQLSEMYAARMPSQDTVAIQATGAGAGRSDLIIGRVEDPNVPSSPWAAPSNIAAGPYVHTRVISGVPATTGSVLDLNLGYTAVTLARVDLPANTAVVTQDMITDLRRVANPRRDRRVYTVNPSVAASLTSTTLADWIGSWPVPIPAWATRAVIVLSIGGIRHSRLNSSTAGTANGQVRAALGTAFTQSAIYDVETTPSNVVARYSAAAADTVGIAAAVRGTTQTLRIQGRRAGGNVALQAESGTFALVDVEFQESAV